jgi:integrase
MTSLGNGPATSRGQRAWPLDVTCYDREPTFSPEEQQALLLFLKMKHITQEDVLKILAGVTTLERMVRPLRDAFAVIEGGQENKDRAMGLLLRTCAREGRTFWNWDHATWLRVLGPTQIAFFQEHALPNLTDIRQQVMAAAYLLQCFQDVQVLGGYDRRSLANKVFGNARVTATLLAIEEIALGWGYSVHYQNAFRGVISEVLLMHSCPELDGVTLDLLEHLRSAPEITHGRRTMLFRLSRILSHLGIVETPLPKNSGTPVEVFRTQCELGIAPDWVAWTERWYQTSVLAPQTRKAMRHSLLKAGRWLALHHPGVTRPEHWTRELAAEYVAAVDRMHIGEYVGYTKPVHTRQGDPLSPRRKSHLLCTMRQCFRDAQEWDWIPRHFNPGRVFATPRSLKALIGPSPRAIADDIWAKLLWAGLNLEEKDFPIHGPTTKFREGNQINPAGTAFYPIAMLRALTLLWLFGGLRSNEIVRLRTGCVRMQTIIPEGKTQADAKTVCLLDIPVHKTGHAFTKPVDALVGEAILAWEKIRPEQPQMIDAKTGEAAHFLFCYRAHRLRKEYLNLCLIPTLCRKAGVPRTDTRGSISSHRARSTIASQLFNAREPMTLFELQAWLGHQSPATTQHYVSTSPTKLAQAYKDAGYFSRNVRAIEVLIDRGAITSGAAVNGSPWRYYDLGHGWCSYEFFDQCPHRMACARCDFYVPKDSTRGQWLETRDDLLKMLQEIPLSDEERAAVDGDVQALNRLLERLKEVPTPSKYHLETLQQQVFIPVNAVLSKKEEKRWP